MIKNAYSPPLTFFKYKPSRAKHPDAN